MAYQIKWLQIAVIMLLSWRSSAWLHGNVDMSKEFEECYSVHENSRGGMTEKLFEMRCTDLLLPFDSSHRRVGNFTAEQLSFIHSLFRKMYSEAYKTDTNRVKRATYHDHESTYNDQNDYHKRGIYHSHETTYNGQNDYHQRHGLWRYRTEVRTANGWYFRKYAERVRATKQAGTYDVIAEIHTVTVSKAHFGVNFLPWHRLYLLVMETLLGVPICYWDSTLDHVMKDPTQSVVWTNDYFGPGIGPVDEGYFAGFQTPAGQLFRKINAGGMLMSSEMITKYVWSKNYLSEISTPTASYKSNLEGQHNNVHFWVNGIMANLAISSFDPVFFTLHAFIDCIWEVFRWKQYTNRINSEFDTGKIFPPGQHPKTKAELDGFINRDGYTNKIAKMVSYRLSAQCPYCDGSHDVYCSKYRGTCVSRRGHFHRKVSIKVQIAMADKLGRKSGLSKGKFGAPFRPFATDPRTRGDSIQPIEMEMERRKKNYL